MENIQETIPEVNTVNTNETQPTIDNDNQVVGNEENPSGQAPNNTNDKGSQLENKQTDDFFNGEKVAKAFSQRLNKEREKLTAQYQPYEKVLDLAAKEFGMSREDYIKQVLQSYGDEGQAPEETKDNTPKSEKELLLEQLLEEKKSKEIAENWNKQTQELLKINNSLKPEDISDEMLIESQEKGIPLHYLYAYNLLTSGRENFEKAIRDKAISDIQKVNKSAGSMQSGNANTNSTKVSDMNSNEFKAYLDKIKRGEIKI